jgi:hypothetical protein
VDWARTFHPSARTFDDAARVVVDGGGSRTGIDIVLQPDPRFSLSGSIVDERGDPARGVRLQYGTDLTMGGGDTRSETGTFSIRDLANGPVHLLATGDGAGGPLIGFLTMEVQGASIANARMTLGAPAVVRGRLVGEGVTLPGDLRLRVQFQLPWQRMGREGAELDAFPISAAGTFEASAIVGPRSIDLVGLPPQWELKAVRRSGRAVPDRRLMLTNGQLVDDVELVVGARN